MTFWSLDLGTCNSTLARWNADARQPEMVALPEICRRQEATRKIQVKYSIPSAVYPHAPRGWQDRLGAWPLLERTLLMGRRALIGRAALEQDTHQRSPAFVHGFKQALMRNSFETLAHLGDTRFTPAQITHLFLRELFAETRRVTGERPRHLTIGTPVDCYEMYRAHLGSLCRDLGIGKPRFIDEPVAAALGYGLSAETDTPILVLDFGAGTLDLALITLTSRDTESGHCRVLAKAGVAVGGNHVDSWVLEDFCARKAFHIHPLTDPGIRWWFRAMMEEARAVKERLFFEDHTHFYAEPPEALRDFDALLKGTPDLDEPLRFERADLERILAARGLVGMLDSCLDGLLADAAAKGVRPEHIGEVLMVGGSSLLPGIYHHMETRFGRDRVRAWQPFHAVAFGGAVFASGFLNKSDFITHDYAFRTYHPKTHEPEHHIVIPRGAPFPSDGPVWKRRVTPTCALGEPESVFKMVVCELGRTHGLEQEFTWDTGGRLHRSDAHTTGDLVVPLNEDNPTLGKLDPPHQPMDRSARLEIAFSVNAERWLVATVQDLKTQKLLMKAEPVVRLK